MSIHLRLIFIPLLFVFEIYSQRNITLTIVDHKTNHALEYVVVTSSDSKLKLVSNKEGKVLLIPDVGIKSFSFYKMGYAEKKIVVDQLRDKDTVRIQPKEVELTEITITSRPYDTILAEKKFYINDYALLPNGEFLLLTSMINIKGCEVVYFNIKKGIIQRKRIRDEKNESLFKDCFGNFHVLTSQYSRQIFFHSDTSFDFLPKYSRMRFDSTLAKCALVTSQGIIASSFSNPLIKKGEYFDNLLFSPFLTYNLVNNNKKELFYFACYNSKVREMLDLEEKDMNTIKKTIEQIGGHAQSAQSMEAQRDLFYSRVSGPVYAPIFRKQDTVIIFNFQEHLIVFKELSGKMIREVKIEEKSYSELREFAVLQDQVSGNFFLHTKESDKSILNRLNIYSGKISGKVKLEKVFGKKISIFNNRVYYLVRENHWDDTRYLYSQQL